MKSRADLLLEPRNNLLLRAATVVVRSLSVLEELKGRESADAIVLGGLIVDGSIYLGKLHRRINQSLSGLSVLGSKRLAVTTPSTY